MENVGVSLINLNGGEIVGRTRLQRLAYLLHRCGADFDLSFDYHHYGPYSFALADDLARAEAEGRIDVEEQHDRHGIPHKTFMARETVIPPRVGGLDADRAGELLAAMRGIPDVVLELAATIVFFRDGRHPDDAAEETQVRKPLKATDDNMKRAHALMDNLGLGDGKACSADHFEP